MKRYLIFGFYDGYEKGGWNDYLTSVDTIEEAQSLVMELENLEPFQDFPKHIKPSWLADTYQIVDSETEAQV